MNNPPAPNRGVLGPVIEALDTTPPATTPPRPQEEPYLVRRERLRGILAVMLVALFVVAVVASFLLFWLLPEKAPELKEFLPLVLTPVTSVVSAVLGFYYGAQARRED